MCVCVCAYALRIVSSSTDKILHFINILFIVVVGGGGGSGGGGGGGGIINNNIIIIYYKYNNQTKYTDGKQLHIVCVLKPASGFASNRL